MRILMVTPYAPERDGIAAYALQSVARLRREGHEVTVLSPRPSAAHLHADLQGWRGALALARHARRFDRVIIQFHPDVFFPVGAPPLVRARTAAALATAFRACADTEVRVHETNYAWGRGRGPAALAVRAMWRAAPRISVHTEAERDDFHRSFGVPTARIHVAAHGGDFLPRTTMGRAEARRSLDIADGDLVFLGIGFIQEHKGFDRAIRAFATLGDVCGNGARLDIVGSTRLDEPGQIAHAQELKRLADATPGARLHSGFISDELFDRWIVAADVVVLPYRFIWSSGVMERAALYGRRVIASRVGGLPDQARRETTLVEDDRELAEAMAAVARDHGLHPGRASRHSAWPAAPAGQDTVMAEIRRRAAQQRSRAPATAVAGRPVAAPGAGDAPAGPPTAALRRIPPLHLPPPVSSRPGGTPVKRIVQRLTAWQLSPLVAQVNALQGAVEDAVARLAENPPAATPGSAGTGDSAAAPPPRDSAPSDRG